ncbi:hypothetical protein [Streptomyces sp. BHT-5-2]|nr:hypothetical protein [Streptomyces sp. BHT-5-2]
MTQPMVGVPTEPIGGVPRPAELLTAMAAHAAGRIGDDELAGAAR